MRLVYSALLFVCCALVCVPAAAQTPPASDAPPPRWERKAELSLVATGGNTDTPTLGAGASLAWRPNPWTTEAKVAFIRSETNDILTARSLAADLRQGRSITPRLDAFGRVGYLSNEFAGIDTRVTLDAGLGYKLLTGTVHTLRVDAGLGYSHEERTTDADLSFPLANFGGAYKWQISPTADFTESALFTASLENADDHRFSNTLALTAVLTRLLSLKLSHELKFVNTPPPTFEKTDTQLSMALVATF